MDYLKILQTIREVSIIITAIIGAIVTIGGLKIWKKEIHGKTEYELSRRLLRSSFKVRDAIYIVRHPFIDINEMIKALEKKGLSKEEVNERLSNSNTDQEVYETRWELIQESVSDLRIEALEAEVLWGDEINIILKDLYEQINKLNFSLRQYLDKTTPTKEEVYEIIYGMRGEVNQNIFTQKIEEAIKKIENYIRPHLKL